MVIATTVRYLHQYLIVLVLVGLQVSCHQTGEEVIVIWETLIFLEEVEHLIKQEYLLASIHHLVFNRFEEETT
jgi:hypothetical protein